MLPKSPYFRPPETRLTSGPPKWETGAMTRLGRPLEYRHRTKLAVYVERADVRRYKRAAKRAGLTLSDWVREAADCHLPLCEAHSRAVGDARSGQGRRPAGGRAQAVTRTGGG